MARNKISKIAKELNLTLSTVIDFLRSKNIEVDGNPNTRIDEYAEALLMQHFSTDMKAKREAEQFLTARQKDCDSAPAAAPAETSKPVEDNTVKYHAFISYSRKDFDAVNAFLENIRAQVPGFNYWFDLDGIESGDEFDDKIVSAIDNSERIIFMLSDNSINSEWTKKEIRYAHNSSKRIIPVLLKGAKLKGWFLFTFGNIDCIDTQDSRQMAKLISNIGQWCGHTPTKPRPSTTTIEAEIPTPVFKNRKWGFNDKKWGYENKKGKIVIPCSYDDARFFCEGRAVVKKDGKYGFINPEGKIIVPLIYDFADSFSEGRAWVKKGDKYGYIDLEGMIVIPLIYDYATSFSDGQASVEKDGKTAFIDKDGKIING